MELHVHQCHILSLSSLKQDLSRTEHLQVLSVQQLQTMAKPIFYNTSNIIVQRAEVKEASPLLLALHRAAKLLLF